MPTNELTIPEQIAVWERIMANAKYQRELADPQLTARVPPPPNRMLKALDIGCGWGRHLVWLAQQGWRATGVDWTHAAIRQCRERLAELHLTAQVIKGDLRRLPFQDADYQVIIAVDVLQHGRLADFKRSLAEIKRVLRVGGQAIFNLPTERNAPGDYAGTWPEERTVIIGSGSEAGIPHHFFTEPEVRTASRMFRHVELTAVVEPLPAGFAPLHDHHVNEWFWVALTG